MLEPHEGKLSRAVLRGGGGSNTPDLPDYCGCGRIGHAAACDAAICGFESRQSPHEIKDLPEPGEESGFRRSFCNAFFTKTSLIRILNQQIKTQPQL